MLGGMDMHAREQYLEQVRKEYRRASKKEKTGSRSSSTLHRRRRTAYALAEGGRPVKSFDPVTEIRVVGSNEKVTERQGPF